MLQLARGIQYMHSLNIVHRDLNIYNILMSTDGQIKIIDLGMAQLDQSGTSAETPSLGGSGQFRDICQVGHQRDYRFDDFSLCYNGKSADVYAFGITVCYFVGAIFLKNVSFFANYLSILQTYWQELDKAEQIRLEVEKQSEEYPKKNVDGLVEQRRAQMKVVEERRKDLDKEIHDILSSMASAAEMSSGNPELWVPLIERTVGLRRDEESGVWTLNANVDARWTIDDVVTHLVKCHFFPASPTPSTAPALPPHTPSAPSPSTAPMFNTPADQTETDALLDPMAMEALAVLAADSPLEPPSKKSKFSSPEPPKRATDTSHDIDSAFIERAALSPADSQSSAPQFADLVADDVTIDDNFRITSETGRGHILKEVAVNGQTVWTRAYGAKLLSLKLSTERSTDPDRPFTLNIRLGKGSYGEVVLKFDNESKRHVAVKIIAANFDDADFVINNEINALARLSVPSDHPGSSHVMQYVSHLYVGRSGRVITAEEFREMKPPPSVSKYKLFLEYVDGCPLATVVYNLCRQEATPAELEGFAADKLKKNFPKKIFG